MEEKKNSEFKTAGKELLSSTAKFVRHIDKELGVKGRIAVIFGIIIIALLGAIVDGRNDYRKFSDRNTCGSMMQNMQRGENGRRMFQREKTMQGCVMQVNQKPSYNNCPFANQINSKKDIQSDSIFDRMGSRMRQIFGSNDSQPTQINIPITGTTN